MADANMTEPGQDASLSPPLAAAAADDQALYGGYTRFELELEVCPAFSSCCGLLAGRIRFLVLEILKIDHDMYEQFVTALSSPLYLNHLATLKLLQQPDFVAYLAYLRYWTRPEYIKFLSYPGPTLRSLELLQEERFRADILSPELVSRMMLEGVEAGMRR